jgi:hypothetical protein
LGVISEAGLGTGYVTPGGGITVLNGRTNTLPNFGFLPRFLIDATLTPPPPPPPAPEVTTVPLPGAVYGVLLLLGGLGGGARVARPRPRGMNHRLVRTGLVELSCGSRWRTLRAPMTDTRFRRLKRLISVCVLSALLFPTAAAADRGAVGLQRVRDDDDERVPTGARRAAEWEPSREGVAGRPWEFSVSAGLAFFSGDDAFDDQPGFAIDLRAAHDLTGDFYVVGSYLLAFARTDVIDELDGSNDRDTKVLHVPTVGVGFRAEVTPEIQLFVEPKLGAVITSDDVGPAGGASAGVDFEVDPGIAVRVGFTGLLTDSRVDTSAGDADLNGIWSVGVGLVFEF